MKKFYVFILLILPVILVFTAALLKYARGPYYICSDTEQDYIYLLSSLSMAESRPVIFTDHPGTTLQMLGAATLKMSHALSLSDKDSLEFSVLKNPEFYLTVINIVLVFLNALLLFIIGLVTFHLSKNIGLSLLLQFSPFFSGIPLRWGLPQVSCEPLLLFVSLLLMLILVKMIYCDNISKSVHWYMITLGLAAGFGIATKLTFVPLLIIPLFVLPTLRNKAGYLLITGLSAVLWTWPIHSQYERIFQRICLMLTHAGWYGTGSSGIDIAYLQTNLLKMLTVLSHDPLTLFFFVTPGLIIVLNWSSTARKVVRQDTSFKLLLGGMVAQLFSVLIVVKQNADRYALPASCLIGFMLFAQLIYLQRRGCLRQIDAKKITFFIVFFLVISGVWRIIAMKDSFQEFLLIKNESLASYCKAENEYKNYLKIYANIHPRAIAPFALAALSWGDYYASHKYLSINEVSKDRFSKGYYSESLQKIYPETYFYNPLTGEFYTWTKSFLIEDMVIKKHINKIIFYGPPNYIKKKDLLLTCKTGSVLHLKDISEGVYDNVYLVDGIRLPVK